MLTILLDGVAYGMLLFVLSCGLSVTLGLMNFINLAHGAFAMVGGYVTALLMNRAGVPFLATLPIAFLVPALLGVVLERTLYRRLYGASPLDQVLFTIGLVLMAMPIANYFPRRPAATGSSAAHGSPGASNSMASASAYTGSSSSSSAAHRRGAANFSWSARVSARSLRAAVDDPRVASGLGINVDRLFAITFAVGSGLAGSGRRAGRRRRRRHRSELPAEIHGDVPDRRHDRRLERHFGRAGRLAAARRARRRGQILRRLRSAPSSSIS